MQTTRVEKTPSKPQLLTPLHLILKTLVYLKKSKSEQKLSMESLLTGSLFHTRSAGISNALI